MNGIQESRELGSAQSAKARTLVNPKKRKLTQQIVRKLFDYRDGKLFWKIRMGGRAQCGDEAGAIDRCSNVSRCGIIADQQTASA